MAHLLVVLLELERFDRRQALDRLVDLSGLTCHTRADESGSAWSASLVRERDHAPSVSISVVPSWIEISISPISRICNRGKAKASAVKS